jgi:type 1 glutamine amidotransferase
MKHLLNGSIARVLLGVLALAAAVGLFSSCTQDRPPSVTRVLVFSKTDGFRHGTIESGLEVLKSIAQEEGYELDHTEDAAHFAPAQLERYDALLFLHTTGDLLTGSQESALREYVEGGGGFVGIHAAADAEYDWPWYGELLGAYFSDHPAVQEATLHVASHSSLTEMVPNPWTLTDEWYNFTMVAEDLTVLLTVDESTYSGGTMGEDHPVSWHHPVGAGRSWYTGLGHTESVWGDQDFRAFLAAGIRYAMGLLES